MMVGAKVSVAEKVMADCCVRNPDGSPAKPEDAWSIPLTDRADRNRRVLEIAERVVALPQGAFDRLVEEVGEVAIFLATMPTVVRTPDGKSSSVPDDVHRAVHALRARFEPDQLKEADKKVHDLLSRAPPPTVETREKTHLLEVLDRVEREADPA
jgi:hypothetical protein